MQLIFMRGAHSQIRTVSIKRTHVVLMGLATVLAVLALFASGFYIAARYGHEIPLANDLAQDRQVELQIQASQNTGPLDAMAIRLAEMRAQLARLDAISLRLLKTNGMDSKLPTPDEVGQGGLEQKDERSLTFSELRHEFKTINAMIERQSDVFSIIDTDMQTARVKFQSIPNESPLDDPISVSKYGYRIDPFTGKKSIHEGIDFMAPVGTPILAAAAGVVVTAGWHTGYGNMIEIEHKNHTTTRYAHASKLLVKPGDIVRLGQKIGLVGTTGRSTGPHLHFEVRVNGEATDPTPFLAKNGLPRPGPSTVAALNGLLSSESAEPPRD